MWISKKDLERLVQYEIADAILKHACLSEHIPLDIYIRLNNLERKTRGLSDYLEIEEKTFPSETKFVKKEVDKCSDGSNGEKK